jgi:hypothetical protein
MSKHALSRIYEKYVALFQPEDSISDGGQLSFVKSTPSQIPQYKSGLIYTPEFIAGFFARFIQDNLTPKSFRELRSIDPACGSGPYVRMRPDVHALPGKELHRAEMVEENKRPHHLAPFVRQRAAHR